MAKCEVLFQNFKRGYEKNSEKFGIVGDYPSTDGIQVKMVNIYTYVIFFHCTHGIGEVLITCSSES